MILIMEEKKTKVTTPDDLTAETGESIDAVNTAEVSKPQSGETTENPAAGDEENKEAEFDKLISGKYR